MEQSSAVGTIPVQLGNGQEILVEATVTTGDLPSVEDVGVPSMEKVAHAIEGVAQDLVGSIQKVKPDKASIELGFEVSGSAGVPLLTKGAAKANIKVTLEWEEESKPAT